MVHIEELDALNSFNASVDCEDGMHALCRFPNVLY